MSILTKPWLTGREMFGIDRYDPSLVLYLPLWYEGLQGSPFKSMDLNEHVCTVTGATWGITGRTFTGGDDVITIPDAGQLLSTGALTVSVWVNFSQLLGGDFVVLASKKNTTFDQANGWYLGYDVDETSLYMRGSGGNVVSSNAINAVISTWYNFVITITGTAVLFYSDGVAKGGGACNAIVANADDYLLGKGSADFPNWFSGVFGEVENWNSVKSAVDLVRHYQITKWRYNS